MKINVIMKGLIKEGREKKGILNSGVGEFARDRCCIGEQI
jgi:hypothetical protein